MKALALCCAVLVAPLVAACNFDFTERVATKLLFTVQPATVTAGALAPAIQVTALDKNGDKATDVGFLGGEPTISLALTDGQQIQGPGVPLHTTVNGVATFSDLTFPRVGTGLHLIARLGSLSVVSDAFDVIAGPPVKLTLTALLSAVTQGTTIAPAIQVSVQDASGNQIVAAGTDVTIAIKSGTGTPGAALTGTTTRTTVAGVAIFDDLSIDSLGTGYTLSATSPGLSSATSVSFSVIGAPAALDFTVQPSAMTAGGVMAPAVQVTVKDAHGGTVTTSTATITLGITAGTGTSGAILVGTVTVKALNGVATFNNVGVDKAGAGYTLTATSGSLPSAISAPFVVN